MLWSIKCGYAQMCFTKPRDVIFHEGFVRCVHVCMPTFKNIGLLLQVTQSLSYQNISHFRYPISERNQLVCVFVWACKVWTACTGTLCVPTCISIGSSEDYL